MDKQAVLIQREKYRVLKARERARRKLRTETLTIETNELRQKILKMEKDLVDLRNSKYKVTKVELLYIIKTFVEVFHNGLIDGRQYAYLAKYTLLDVGFLHQTGRRHWIEQLELYTRLYGQFKLQMVNMVSLEQHAIVRLKTMVFLQITDEALEKIYSNDPVAVEMKGKVLQVPNTMVFHFEGAQIRRVDWHWDFLQAWRDLIHDPITVVKLLNQSNMVLPDGLIINI